MDKSNILYGKKLVACGDSFTEGDFVGYVDENGLSYKNSPVIYDPVWGMYKTYPWWIAQRNDMELINEAKCGSTMALSKKHLENPDTVPADDHLPFALERYKQVPLDADYVLLQFGLNDMFACQLGTIDDTGIDTFYGAYNTVLEYFITNLPFAKIGTVVSNAYLHPDFRQAIIDVSVKWGIPYLDMMADPTVSATLTKTGMCERAIAIRNSQFYVTEKNGHPNHKAHELNSYIYEAFLRRI